MYRFHHLPKTDNTLLSRAHETFFRINYILQNSLSVHKVIKLESISNIFSNHSSMKVEIVHKKKADKISILELDTTILKNSLVKSKSNK